MHKILIIDDDELSIRPLIDFLEKYSEIPLEIEYYSDSEKALSILRKKSFDIIATDLIMPKVNGRKILVEGKRLNAYKKSILFSAFIDKIIIQDLLNSKLIDISIEKPIDYPIFRDYIKKLIIEIENHKNEYDTAIDILANKILNGKNMQEVEEKIIMKMLEIENYHVQTVSNKTGINVMKLYNIRKKNNN